LFRRIHRPFFTPHSAFPARRPPIGFVSQNHSSGSLHFPATAWEFRSAGTLECWNSGFRPAIPIIPRFHCSAIPQTSHPSHIWLCFTHLPAGPRCSVLPVLDPQSEIRIPQPHPELALFCMIGSMRGPVPAGTEASPAATICARRDAEAPRRREDSRRLADSASGLVSDFPAAPDPLFSCLDTIQTRPAAVKRNPADTVFSSPTVGNVSLCHAKSRNGLSATRRAHDEQRKVEHPLFRHCVLSRARLNLSSTRVWNSLLTFASTLSSTCLARSHWKYALVAANRGPHRP
jgi:hypothetical protein